MITIEINEQFNNIEELQDALVNIVDQLGKGEVESPYGTKEWYVEGYEEPDINI